jgi:hypothetical protein
MAGPTSAWCFKYSGDTFGARSASRRSIQALTDGLPVVPLLGAPLEHGISQQQLALDCELDRTYISLIERGVQSPTIRTVAKDASTKGILARAGSKPVPG